MELDNVFLNKLPIVAATGGDGTWNHYAFIESTWGERKILLKIIVFSSLYNTPLSFVSEIEHEVLQQTALRLEHSWEDFLQETKLALCTEGGANGFSYAVEENNFVWRKILGPQLTFTYGSVILLRSQCLLSDVLSNSIHAQNRLRTDVLLKNKILRELKEEHEELLEFQRQQEEDTRLYEIELITKCISILNEKKEVISHLKKQLGEDEDEQTSEGQTTPPPEAAEAPPNSIELAACDMRAEKAGCRDEFKTATASRTATDYTDSEPFDLDSEGLQEPEEHGILPKRTKYQMPQRSSTSTPGTSGSTSTAPRCPLSVGAMHDEARDDDIYNKDTEELLQEI
ncbi:uncharacterized protein LOC131212602 [Anopheles bellator]|uniref:uncharacterized protein LOC131212602 n=1 Tax=Anopheles bellator TaxID=139047 RepID=UPI00264A29AA|nr:uncharacterized protein LOC131212602 [Anopheles bellator]